MQSNLPAATLQQMQQAPSLPQLHVPQSSPQLAMGMPPPGLVGAQGAPSDERTMLQWPPPGVGATVNDNGGVQGMGFGAAETGFGGMPGNGGMQASAYYQF